MCGIVGLIGQTKADRWQESHRILTHLLLAAQVRGKDATGYVARPDSLERAAQRSNIVAKQPLPPSKFIETPAWQSLKHRRCSMILGHVRWATHGSPDNSINNHPHVSGHLSLVHNGVLFNHRDLIDKYCLRVESECDSEVLLRIIERAKSPAIGISLCLLEHPGAIVVYDEHRDCLWLGRDESRPLWIGRMKGDRRLWFASTSAILLDGISDALQQSVAWEFVVPLAPNFIFQATSDGSIGAVFEEPIASKSIWGSVDKTLPEG